MPKRHPRYALVDPDVPDPLPPEAEELRQFLHTLPAEEVYKLLAIADVGRGLPACEFETRWQKYADDAPELSWAIEYLSLQRGFPFS